MQQVAKAHSALASEHGAFSVQAELLGLDISAGIQQAGVWIVSWTAIMMHQLIHKAKAWLTRKLAV